MRKLIVPALAVLSLTAIATPAVAEEKSVVVTYGDLNLLNEAGVAQLENRVRRAVKKLCGQDNPRDLRALKSQNDCRRDALQRATIEVAHAVERERTLALAAMLQNGRGG